MILPAAAQTSECENDTVNGACQEPYYADDQNVYNYDNDASWVFENSDPSQDGPTIFFGSQVVENNPSEPGTIHKDEENSGNLVEKYVNDPSEAEGGSQENFGRGEVRSNTISSITNQYIDSNSNGENFLVTPPNEGMCGDGIVQGDEDDSGSSDYCPEDAGLPETKTVSSPTPSKNGKFDEAGSTSESLSTDSAGPSEIHVDGDVSPQNFPDYYVKNDYIVKVDPESDTSTYETIDHTYEKSVSGVYYRSLTDPKDNFDGGNATILTGEYCTDVEKTEEPLYEEVNVEPEGTEEYSTSAEVYKDGEVEKKTEGNIEWIISGRGTYFAVSARAHNCVGTTKTWDCSCDPSGQNPDCDCTEDDIEAHQSFNGAETAETQTIALTYDDYDTDKDFTYWDPNDDLSFSSGNVINGNNGYFAYGSPVDSRDASNDPSVSKSTYGVYRDGGSFIANRQSLTVANADGQNGRSNGIVAYNEDSNSISGSTEGFLSSELVDYNVKDYLESSDVKSKISCPEDRCLASVDVTTERSGWSHYGTGGFSPQVYSVSVDSTVSVRDSAGACETYKDLNPGVSDQELDCSPGPNFDVCGAYTQEEKIFFEGPDVSANADSYKAHYEACLRPQNGDSDNMCVEPNRGSGTRKVDEGVVRNITPFYHNDTYQSGGNAADPAVCLNTDSDTGGEWYNLDDWKATEYVRKEIGDNSGVRSDALASDEWMDYWIDEHPDQDADPKAIDPKILGQTFNSETMKGGFALEQDCWSGQDCATYPGSHQENSGDFDINVPYEGGKGTSFEAGRRELDYSTNASYDFNLSNVQNQVLSGETDDYIAVNTQDEETPRSISTEALNNSRINAKDDEWALAPNLSFGVNNYGEPRLPEQCHGASRVQGENLTKRDRDYANSYVYAQNDIYSGGESSGKKDGMWIDPDDSSLSAFNGELSCDLTGMDWGYGFNESGYTDGDVTCVEGDCFEPGYSSFDPMVVVGDISFDENASGPGFNGPACGDDPGEILLREYETGQFDPDVNTFACTDKPNKCVHNGTVYEEGSMLNAGEGRPDDEDIQSSPDREICLGVNDEVPGSSWHEIDDRDNARAGCRSRRLRVLSGVVQVRCAATRRLRAGDRPAREAGCRM